MIMLTSIWRLRCYVLMDLLSLPVDTGGGYFPSVSAGWAISEEAFMESAKSWMDFLKIRASWGTEW